MTRSPRGTQVGLLRLRAGDGLRPVRETVPGPSRFSQADDGARADPRGRDPGVTVPPTTTAPRADLRGRDPGTS